MLWTSSEAIWLNVESRRSGEKPMGWNRVSLSRSELVKLRVKARRRGVWFKILTRVERGLLDLAIKVVEKVRSLVLARSLISVVKKLTNAMESEVTRLMRTVGRRLAQKLSEIAQEWGNKVACLWAVDLDFIQYLAVMEKNLSPIFRI
jgi:hypothetical protein